MCLIKILNFEHSSTTNENTSHIYEIDMSLFLYTYLCVLRILFFEKPVHGNIDFKTFLNLKHNWIGYFFIFIRAIASNVYIWSNEVFIQSLKNTDNLSCDNLQQLIYCKITANIHFLKGSVLLQIYFINFLSSS